MVAWPRIMASNNNNNVNNNNVVPSAAEMTRGVNASNVGADEATMDGYESEVAAMLERDFCITKFRRWSRKMKFFLTTMRLERFLTEIPENLWNDNHSLCKHLLLEKISDDLRSEYRGMPTVKDIWASLNVRFDKLNWTIGLLSRIVHFKMVDPESCMPQVIALLGLLEDLENADDMRLTESEKVAFILRSLPPSWKVNKDFVKYLRKDMTLMELVKRIEMQDRVLNASTSGEKP